MQKHVLFLFILIANEIMDNCVFIFNLCHVTFKLHSTLWLKKWMSYMNRLNDVT